MLSLHTYQLGDLSTNTYLVINDETKSALIIDPADDANFISEQLLYHHLTPQAIIATHGHFDHLLAAWELEMAFNIPTLIHEKDIPLLKHLTRSASWWLKKKIIEKPPQNLIPLGNSVISKTLPDFDLEVTPTPGHTPGGICLHFPQEKWLLTGDTLFANGVVGRTDLPYSSQYELSASLKKLAALPPELTIYPGHGETDILDHTLGLVN